MEIFNHCYEKACKALTVSDQLYDWNTYMDPELKKTSSRHGPLREKQVTESLLDNHALLKTISECSTDAIYVKDTHGRYLLFNQEAARVTGKKAEDVIGKDDYFLFPSDEAETVMDGDRKVMESGQVTTYEEVVTTTAGITTYLSTKGPVYDEKRKLIGLFGIARDITERKRAEEEIKKSELRLKESQEVAKIGSWSHYVASNSVAWSDECFNRFDKEPQSFQPSVEYFLEHMHPDDREPVQKAIREAIENDQQYHIQARIKNESGREWLMEAFGKLEKDVNGKPVRLAGTAQDITEHKRTEDTLRISEAKLNRAQLIGKLGYWSWDVLTNELDWSDQVFRIYGLDPARDMPSLDIVTKTVAPEYAEAFTRALQEAVENDAPFDGDYAIILPDGSRRYTHTSGEIIRDEQGKPLKMFGIIQDISERKRAEELVKKQLAEITSYYDYAPIGLAVLDTDLRFLRINEYLADINGFTVAEHINKTVEELVPTLAEQGQKVIDEIIRTGKPLREIEITGETAAQQGVTHTWLEGWHPLKDGDEKIIGFTIIVQDISERKQVEQALQNSEAGLREAQHLAMIGSWDWDIATDDISWSDEYYRISGFEIGSPTPNYIEHLKVYTPESAARLDAAVKKTMDDGTLYDLDLEYALPTAKTRWILARGEPKRDSEGKIVGLRGTVQDITERKRYEQEKETLQEQLAQSQKLESVGRLAGGIAHDYNNSLQVILGNTDMAMMVAPQGSSLRESLEAVRRAGEHSAALTMQLLAFARKQAIEPKMLDLNETIAGYMDLLKRSIGENITFSWEPQAESALVRADHNQIYQALTNLCTNARDAIAGTGKIEIVTHNVRLDETDCAGHIDFRPGDYVMLEVSDDGCGMEPDVLENIFEPFFTTKTFGNSSGLGLATVHGIVTQSEGFIDVQSELGKGAVFKIYLPLVEGGEAAAESLPEAKPVEGHGETVLLVEDEAAILKLEVKVLERLGYKVIPTATPEEALQEAREHIKDIDILVTDVIMPQMNGEELAAMLREFKPELKCLYMSGYTDDIVTHNGVLEKGVNFIQKPFSMEEIGLKIQQMINYE